MCLVEHVAVERSDADVDVKSAERADDYRASLPSEPQRPRRAPAGGWAELTVLEIADLDRVIDPLGDHPSTESGDSPNLGAGRGITATHHVDDAQQARHFVGLSAETQG